MRTSAARACEKLDRYLAEEFRKNGEEACANGGKIGAFVAALSLEAAIEVCRFFEEHRLMPNIKGTVKAVKDPKRVGAYRVLVEYEVPAATKPGIVLP